jgi:hypothetical protein
MGAVRKNDESGHGGGITLLLLVLFGGYMVYTGIYDPLQAARHLFDTILGLLPGEISRIIRQIVDLVAEALGIVWDMIDQLVQQVR